VAIVVNAVRDGALAVIAVDVSLGRLGRTQTLRALKAQVVRPLELLLGRRQREQT